MSNPANPKDRSVFYTQQETLDMVRRLPKLPGKVYGMRRMGVPLAFAYCALHGNELAETATEADIIIDDTLGGSHVEPGKTYRRMALHDKTWLVLIYNPATEIPLSDKLHCVLVGDPAQLKTFPMEFDLVRSEFSTADWERDPGMVAHVAVLVKRILPPPELKQILRNARKVLILEDLASRVSEFKVRLPQAAIVTTAAACIEELRKNRFDLLFLDHDLEGDSAVPMPSEHANTGTEVARYLATQPLETRPTVIVHSSNPVGARNIIELLPEAYYRPNAQRFIPMRLA